MRRHRRLRHLPDLRRRERLRQYNTCLNSFDCLDYNACIDTCVDQLCYDDCGYYYPVGESQFLDYAVCVVCGACYNDCDGASACI